MLRSVSVILVLALTCSSARAQHHTERGAVLGGLSGALIGAAVGNHNGEGTEGALVGGAIGLFSGAALGNSLDREEAQWRAQQQHQQSVQLYQAVSLSDVVQMSQGGLSDRVIMNQIAQRGIQRKVQVPDVIYLHQQGVSDAVITTMQRTGVATSVVVRPAPAIVERHHYVTPAPYWRLHRYPPHPYYRSRYAYRPGVRFGISVGN